MSNVAYADFSARTAVRSNRMENQKSGFIPLYRSVLKQPWSKDVFLRTLWDNLLLNAARQPYTANFKGRQWPLQTGQLVTTSADLGLSLCDRNGEPASRHAVDRMLAVFENEGMISRAGEKRKGTVITIANYAGYAQKTTDLPAHFPAQIAELMPAHGESSSGAGSDGDAENKPALNPEQFRENHEQQGNNNNKNLKRSSSENSGESSDKSSKKLPVVKPDAAIQSGNKWGNSEDLRCAEWLFTEVLRIAPTAKQPNYAAWANDIRLMRECDQRTHKEIATLFKWACSDDFWEGNCLCPSTLRKKWTQLDIKRRKQTATRGKAKTGTGALDNTDWINGVFK